MFKRMLIGVLRFCFVMKHFIEMAPGEMKTVWEDGHFLSTCVNYKGAWDCLIKRG